MNGKDIDMPDYKDFSEDEERIYDIEIGKLIKRLQSGQSLDEACSAIEAVDEELKQVIADDVLKIVIAELHYNQGMNFEQVAQRLNITVKQIEDTNRIMIEDVMLTVKNKNSTSGTA
ncbi:MAG: hypothetical protein GXO95_01475 [Nitrospirae bacterium]|nr:hypothetical protein [Nitrospirota bacterium]